MMELTREDIVDWAQHLLLEHCKDISFDAITGHGELREALISDQLLIYMEMETQRKRLFFK